VVVHNWWLGDNSTPNGVVVPAAAGDIGVVGSAGVGLGDSWVGGVVEGAHDEESEKSIPDPSSRAANRWLHSRSLSPLPAPPAVAVVVAQAISAQFPPQRLIILTPMHLATLPARQ
jgi:hypothetical protein